MEINTKQILLSKEDNNLNIDNNDEDLSDNLQVIDLISDHGDSFRLDQITNKRKISLSSTLSNSTKKQKLGYLLSILAFFCWATNSIFLKIIQRLFKENFDMYTFLLTRGLMVFILALSLANYNQEKILKWSEIKYKLYFFIRTYLNFFDMLFWTISVWYLRVSTCQIISTLQPIVVIFLSIFILNEKFYMRYFYGVIICLIGSFIIVKNEKKASNSIIEDKSNNEETLVIGIIIGLTCNIVGMCIGALIQFANKILAKNKIPVSTQMTYVGVFHVLNSFICVIFRRYFYVNGLFITLSMLHGILFYIGCIFFNKSVQLIDLSISIIFSYSKIVFVFILGFIILGEAVFLTDLIGACLIISFMVYNVLNPIK